ncbi:MAG: hypothetical protein M3518_02015 [Actinomycetota bacterium]|nr:hypothetical protein [Actinomycetota bacterium]
MLEDSVAGGGSGGLALDGLLVVLASLLVGLNGLFVAARRKDLPEQPATSRPAPIGNAAPKDLRKGIRMGATVGRRSRRPHEAAFRGLERAMERPENFLPNGRGPASPLGRVAHAGRIGGRP